MIQKDMYLQGGDDASGSAADGWMGFRVTQRAVGYDKHVQSESCATVSAEVKAVLLLYCKPPSHLRLQQVVMDLQIQFLPIQLASVLSPPHLCSISALQQSLTSILWHVISL